MLSEEEEGRRRRRRRRRKRGGGGEGRRESRRTWNKICLPLLLLLAVALSVALTRLMRITFSQSESSPMPALLHTMSSDPNLLLVWANAATCMCEISHRDTQSREEESVRNSSVLRRTCTNLSWSVTSHSSWSTFSSPYCCSSSLQVLSSCAREKSKTPTWSDKHVVTNDHQQRHSSGYLSSVLQQQASGCQSQPSSGTSHESNLPS